MKTSNHLHHIEDLALICPVATNILQQRKFFEFLCDPFKNTSSGILTAKIDGAPAFVCGPVPSGEKYAGDFFVGTKSVFNVTPKYYTKHNLQDAYKENKPEVAIKIERLWHALNRLGIPYIVQGDVLFTCRAEQEFIDEGISVKPNVVSYYITQPAIFSANLGVVFHTIYQGNTFASLSVAWNTYPTIVSTNSATFVLNNQLDMIRPRSSIVANLFREYCKQEQYLRATGADIINDSTVEQPATKFILKYINDFIRKKEPFKPYEVMTYDLIIGLDYLLEEKYIGAIKELLKLFLTATSLKEAILQECEPAIEGVHPFINDTSVPTGEGFVLSSGLTAVKIVDRRVFSHANFTQEKTWR